MRLKKQLEHILNQGKTYWTYKDNYKYRKKDYYIDYERRRNFAKVKLLLKLPEYKLFLMEIWQYIKRFLKFSLFIILKIVSLPFEVMYKISEAYCYGISNFYYLAEKNFLNTRPIWQAKDREGNY